MSQVAVVEVMWWFYIQDDQYDQISCWPPTLPPIVQRLPNDDQASQGRHISHVNFGTCNYVLMMLLRSVMEYFFYFSPGCIHWRAAVMINCPCGGIHHITSPLNCDDRCDNGWMLMQSYQTIWWCVDVLIMRWSNIMWWRCVHDQAPLPGMCGAAF